MTSWPKPKPELRDPWYRAVIKHPTLSNPTKLLLVVMVDDMKVDGYVSVPRSVLAEKMGLHPSRITERIREAVNAKVLDVVVSGKPGTTAVYCAVMPGQGAPVRTKRPRKRPTTFGAPVRTTSAGDMVRIQDQAEVHPSAPSVTLTLGAPVQSPSTTQPTDASDTAVPGEVQERCDEKNDESSADDDRRCRSCHGVVEDLDDNGRCDDLECIVARTVAARQRAAS